MDHFLKCLSMKKKIASILQNQLRLNFWYTKKTFYWIYKIHVSRGAILIFCQLNRGEAAKLAHLLESASLKESIWLKIMKKCVLNSWISFLHFLIDKDCSENYWSRCYFRFLEDCGCINLLATSSKLAQSSIFSCHVLVIFLYIQNYILLAKVTENGYL